MRLFGVTGHPVLHSRSPQIFARLFSAGRIDAAYTRVGARTAAEALSLARRLGMSGLNVTSPFKEEMFRLADTRDANSSQLGATNTVAIGGDTSSAFNTDPDGVRHALDRGRIVRRGSRIVVLGAGGAARAAIVALVADGADVVVSSRTSARAVSAAGLGCRWAELGTLPDLLATAAGLVSCLPGGVDAVDEESLDSRMWVLDANYRQSPLAAKARRRGCLVLDGLDWLIGQARSAYRVFTGMEPASDLRFDETDGPAVAEETGGPRLAIAGMMGAGKSAVGRMLAQRLAVDFVDTDELIVERTGHEIDWLFAHRGEEEFRRIETDTVRRAIDTQPRVIALGGGSLESEATRTAVGRLCRVVWLWASPACLAERAKAGPARRPLLDGADMEPRLAELLSSRTRTYASAASLVVDAERPLDDVVDLIEFEVGRLKGAVGV